MGKIYTKLIKLKISRRNFKFLTETVNNSNSKKRKSKYTFCGVIILFYIKIPLTKCSRFSTIYHKITFQNARCEDSSRDLCCDAVRSCSYSSVSEDLTASIFTLKMEPTLHGVTTLKTSTWTFQKLTVNYANVRTSEVHMDIILLLTLVNY
jgi:hypothetical protein